MRIAFHFPWQKTRIFKSDKILQQHIPWPWITATWDTNKEDNLDADTRKSLDTDTGEQTQEHFGYKLRPCSVYRTREYTGKRWIKTRVFFGYQHGKCLLYRLREYCWYIHKNKLGWAGPFSSSKFSKSSNLLAHFSLLKFLGQRSLVSKTFCLPKKVEC